MRIKYVDAVVLNGFSEGYKHIVDTIREKTADGISWVDTSISSPPKVLSDEQLSRLTEVFGMFGDPYKGVAHADEKEYLKHMRDFFTSKNDIRTTPHIINEFRDFQSRINIYKKLEASEIYAVKPGRKVSKIPRLMDHIESKKETIDEIIRILEKNTPEYELYEQQRIGFLKESLQNLNDDYDLSEEDYELLCNAVYTSETKGKTYLLTNDSSIIRGVIDFQEGNVCREVYIPNKQNLSVVTTLKEFS